MVWCGVVWYGVVQCGVVWYGMVWYGMVWYGMVWYGMIWYGMVCIVLYEKLRSNSVVACMPDFRLTIFSYIPYIIPIILIYHNYTRHADADQR